MTPSRLNTATRILGILTLIAMAVSLYMALIWSPPERTMLGDSVRILYFHAPAAWTAYLSFGVVAIASVMYLWKRKHIWDIIALASAEIGVLLTTLTLISGMLWGKTVWGTFWTWDPRLTTTLLAAMIFAPRPMACLIVGSASRMRESSVIFPASSIGTLKSTRTNTRFLSMGRSRMHVMPSR